MKAKVGNYYFGRRGRGWNIYVYTEVNEHTGFISASYFKYCFSFDEALRTVYALNGWGEPKQIKRQF